MFYFAGTCSGAAWRTQREKLIQCSFSSATERQRPGGCQQMGGLPNGAVPTPLMSLFCNFSLLFGLTAEERTSSRTEGEAA